MPTPKEKEANNHQTGVQTDGEETTAKGGCHSRAGRPWTKASRKKKQNREKTERTPKTSGQEEDSGENQQQNNEAATPERSERRKRRTTNRRGSTGEKTTRDEHPRQEASDQPK